MFDKKTVVILGAGASAPFGFPLGAPLYEHIIAGVGQLRQEVEKERVSRIRSIVSSNNVQQFSQKPISSLARYMANPMAKSLLPSDLVADHVFDQMIDFHNALRRQSADTIDRFLRDNPRHLSIGKALLSLLIFTRMYETDDSRLKIRNFANRDYGGRRNWYHLLINQIREGARDPDSLYNNNLSIVTFNYDQSLERALINALDDTEIHEGVDYKDVVDIYHVNGTVEKLPDTIMDVGEFALNCANDLSLIDEEVGSITKNVRAAAQQAIAEAERVYVMGFHFDRSNTSTIGLTRGDRRRVYCLNFDGHVGMNQRISQFRIPERNIRSGTKAQPLHIDTAIDQGFLEQ